MEQIERRDFSFVSIMYRLAVRTDKYHPVGTDHRNYKVIAGSPFKAPARKAALAYAVMRWGIPSDITVYPRNYIQDARAMVRRGECVQVVS